MKGVFSAELAVFVHLESVGVVLFVLHGVVISLLAFRAGQRNLNSHFSHLRHI